MELIVDLHLHSHYSRATSHDMTLESLYKWAKIKGVNVIGTGDFTHPSWFAEIQDKLEPAETGLFQLKDDLSQVQNQQLPQNLKNHLVRFILTSEISNIYSRLGRTRKMHNLLVAPDFATVAEINRQLAQIGNLKSDGRPILGYDSFDLLKLCLSTNPNILFIPAHIWTPWFSLFGSKSGFNSLEEAFGDLTPHIKAVETGLSSDPYMNWRLSALDHITLLSHSDAHSPSKIGREANVLNCQLTYQDIRDAIVSGDNRLIGTIEFFPQEGKYHSDGHASCRLRLSPSDSLKYGNNCPKCGKKLTLGVEHRIEELANRPADFIPSSHKQVDYIIPLQELIAEIKNVKSANSPKVVETYFQVVNSLGDEFSILRHLPIDQISQAGFNQLSIAISHLRHNQIFLEPGYDGIYGIIRVFGNSTEIAKFSGQMTFL